jgi:hypothetical protein
MDINEKSSNKNLLSLANSPGKENPRKMENLVKAEN